MEPRPRSVRRSVHDKSVRVITNGAAAIDLVLTDIDMPDINGFEMIRRLKQTSTHVQFIAMSGGYSIESVKKVADLLGARHTFKKPLHMPNLLTAIHQVTHPKQPQ